MRHFTHQKGDWKDIKVGTRVHGSKHNTPVPYDGIIREMKVCSYPCGFSRKCYSDNTGWIIDGITNCIYNREGKSFWEEVDDAI